MESERECPTPGNISIPVLTRISWCQDRKTSLVNIDLSIPTDMQGEARTQELERRWVEANPTMPENPKGAQMSPQECIGRTPLHTTP